MKRVFLALAAVVVFTIPAIAADWTIIASKLRESIVSIENEDGRCSGFVIDNDRDFVLTAAHCDGKELYVDLSPAKIRAKDVKNDLMVLFVEGIDRPALKLGNRPKIGDDVASYGFGWGWERPLFRLAHVSDDNTIVPQIEGGPWIVVDADFIPGQSGGPIVNTKGEVVSIVQRTGGGLGLGVGSDVIAAKMGKYFTGGKG